MTRINLIDPRYLRREHLVAEYRELPRVLTLAKAAKFRGEQPDDKRNPQTYTLGLGHVRFFYPRLRFLLNRHAALVREMDVRGYNAKIRTMFLGAGLLGMGEAWLGDYVPTSEALRLNLDRIVERGGLHNGINPKEIF